MHHVLHSTKTVNWCVHWKKRSRCCRGDRSAGSYSDTVMKFQNSPLSIITLPCGKWTPLTGIKSFWCFVERRLQRKCDGRTVSAPLAVALACPEVMCFSNNPLIHTCIRKLHSSTRFSSANRLRQLTLRRCVYAGLYTQIIPKHGSTKFRENIECIKFPG